MPSPTRRCRPGPVAPCRGLALGLALIVAALTSLVGVATAATAPPSVAAGRIACTEGGPAGEGTEPQGACEAGGEGPEAEEAEEQPPPRPPMPTAVAGAAGIAEAGEVGEVPGAEGAGRPHERGKDGATPVRRAQTLVAPSDTVGHGATAAPVTGTPVAGAQPDRPPASPGDLAPPAGLGGASAISLGRLELPPLLLPVYEACGTAYDVPWQVLAAINKVESDFGSDTGPSPAGAVGPMQFMPSTWREYGLDADGDGVADPWDPFDAICAAARYLRTAGAPADLQKAIFAYNHAGWYVAEVLREARDLEALPEDLLASTTSLAEGRTLPDPETSGWNDPAAARASLGSPRWLTTPGLPGAGGDAGEEGVAGPEVAAPPVAEVAAPTGSPVTAVADATVVAEGRGARLGTYLVLRDAYGTRYTYSHLGRLRRRVASVQASRGTRAIPSRPRLYADPRGAAAPGSDASALRTEALTPSPRPRRLALRRGLAVRAGEVLGSVGSSAGFDFAVRPDGSGPIDPSPFLRAWGRHGVSGIFLHPKIVGGEYGSGRGRDRSAAASPAAMLIAGGAELRRRALAGRLLELPACMRRRISAGGVAARPLAGIEFLAASSGERLGLSSRTCQGAGGFHLAVESIGGVPVGASAEAGALAAAARRMQGADGPRRVHETGPPTPAGAGRDASEARISSRPDTGEVASSSALLLDFAPPQAASIGAGGDAIAPIGAPPAVQAMIAAADQIDRTPYVWGGGHGAWVSAGYDCSGSVSYVLHAAGLLATPETSGALESFGDPGPGRWVTIYADAEHVYAEIAGLRWDTVGDAAGTGPRWHLGAPYPEGFVVRHPAGL